MTKPAALHLFPPEAFPITIRIFSGKDGSELWSKTIERPDGLAAVEIPGYGHTDHVPVVVHVERSDTKPTERS